MMIRVVRAFRMLLVVAGIALLNPMVAMGHSAATPLKVGTSHGVHEASHHAASQAPSCTSVCAVALPKDDELQLTDHVEDDEPAPPRQLGYIVDSINIAAPEKISSGHKFDRLVFRPPDLVKLYANFRL